VHDLVAGDFNGDGVIDVAMSAEIDNGNWSYTGVVIITGTSDSPQMPGDLNGDGTVGAEDLAILLGSWGPCDGCPADLNGDGIVDAFDLAQLLGNWG
jgi:predicted lipoprotein with Yx(FWY)xxD motif